MSIVFLMYHELELPGRKLVQSEPGYVRYILPLDQFREQMQWIKDAGFRGISVSEAIRHPQSPSVCITFDDGSETDLIAAAPILSEFGFGATFYVTAGFLDTPGFLSSSQLRELDSLGLEVGCHSMTHPYLSDLPDAEQRREIVDAKLLIEQVVGHPIQHFSCPGGRYDSRTLEMARRAGFRTVANSDFRPNSARSSMYKLGRVAMLRAMSVAEFGSICRGEGLWRKRWENNARQSVRRILGNRAYDHLRASLLKSS